MKAVSIDASSLTGSGASVGSSFMHMASSFISVAGDLISSSTSSCETVGLDLDLLVFQQTTSGLSVSDGDLYQTSQSALMELRRVSGLTWEQLAQLFGVSRRSLHLWASGKPMATKHQQRLYDLLDLVRYVARGTTAETRSVLMMKPADGVSAFKSLSTGGNCEDIKLMLGHGNGRSRSVPPRLSPRSRAERMPSSPEELVGALHDTVHKNVGRARVARSTKVMPKD